MIELVLLLAVAAYAFLVGRRLLSFSGCELVTRAGRLAAATALGLGCLAYTVFVVGLLHRLTVPWVLTAAMVVAAVVHLAWAVRERKEFVASSGPAVSSGIRPSRGELLQIALVTVALVGTLISALAPATSGDALCYHLEIPKRFVQLGAVSYLPLTDNSLFPFLMEMLYTLGLLVSGPVLAQLIHWLIGVLFGLAVVELAAPILGKPAANWAAIVALLVPGVTNQMTAPLNDLAVALYSTLMVVAWRRWDDTHRWGWLVLAGVFGGLGLSVKLVTAAMVTVLMVALAIREFRRHGMALMCQTLALFAVTLVVTGGSWYARSWYYLGNPIYPYFNAFFGLEAHTKSLLIASRNPITLPWMATMHPEDFGGRGVQFGAVFLAMLPGLALVRRRSPALTLLLIVALAYSTFWFAFRQDLRFLLPAVPLLAIAVVAVVREVQALHRPAFVVATSCLACLLLFQGLIVLKRARPCLAVALGRESREAYLRRHEPSYEVAQFVNTRLPDCRLISQDYRGLYFKPDFVREDAMRRRTPYQERGEELVARLSASGFTHVLLVESHNPASAVYDQSFAERLGQAKDRLPVVLTSHFDGPSGDCRDYKLLVLPRPSGGEPYTGGHRAPLRGVAN